MHWDLPRSVFVSDGTVPRPQAGGVNIVASGIHKGVAVIVLVVTTAPMSESGGMRELNWAPSWCGLDSS